MEPRQVDDCPECGCVSSKHPCPTSCGWLVCEMPPRRCTVKTWDPRNQRVLSRKRAYKPAPQQEV